MLATSARVGVRPTLPSRRAAVVVKAQGEREGPLSRFAAGTVATLTAAALMTSAMVPEEALAAKSSGRVGGSSGFKSRRVESAGSSTMRAAPAPPIRAQSAPAARPPDRARTTGVIGGATSRFSSSKSQARATPSPTSSGTTPVTRPRDAPSTSSSSSTALAVVKEPPPRTPQAAAPLSSTTSPAAATNLSAATVSPMAQGIGSGMAPAAAPAPPRTSSASAPTPPSTALPLATSVPLLAPATTVPLTGASPRAVFPDAPASRPARSTSTTTVNNVVVGAPMVAPPVFGGFGYGSPFGFSIMPTFVMPFPFFGGLLQFFFLITVVSLIFNVVRTLGAGANKSNNKGDKDGWGDL